MHWFLKFIFGTKLYTFRTVPLSIIRSFSLYTMVICQLCSKMSVNLYVLLCVQWKTPDDGQRNCPKHVEFYSKNKFEKLVHLVGFIIRILWYFSHASIYVVLSFQNDIDQTAYMEAWKPTIKMHVQVFLRIFLIYFY